MEVRNEGQALDKLMIMVICSYWMMLITQFNGQRLLLKVRTAVGSDWINQGQSNMRREANLAALSNLRKISKDLKETVCLIRAA